MTIGDLAQTEVAEEKRREGGRERGEEGRAALRRRGVCRLMLCLF